MDTAIGWARKTGLKVIIDLHGAPLSQNGYDNSGHNGTVGWGQNNSIADTLSVVQLIANKYAKKEYSDVVMGIELLNEPLVEFIKPGFGAVMQFYNDGFGNVRQVGQTPIVMHDGFLNGSVWDGTLTVPGAQNIIVDHHEYQVFTDELLAQSSEVSLSPQNNFDLTASPTATRPKSLQQLGHLRQQRGPLGRGRRMVRRDDRLRDLPERLRGGLTVGRHEAWQ